MRRYTKKYQAAYVVLLLISSLISEPVNANSCAVLVNTINADINKYNKTINTQHLPWMSLAWLQKNLGNPVTTKLSDQVFQFSWTCGDDAQSSLVIQTDANKKFILVKGQYNSMEGSGLFSADLSQLEPKQWVEYSVTPATNPQASPEIKLKKSNTSLDTQQQAYVAEGEKITQRDFKNWFNIDLLDQKSKATDIPLNLTRAYYAKLRQCIPGTYKYPVFNSSFGIIPHQGIFF